MKDRSFTLGVGAVAAGVLALSISLYSTAHAQVAGTGAQTPPAAGPRGIGGAQDLQQPPRANPTPFAPQGGGGESIAADQGTVYVLRGNVVFVLGRDQQTGRLRVFDQVELPGGRPIRDTGQRIRPRANPGGQKGTPPPPKK
ncbi:MAG TPA: hypothetical protein VHE55_00690 [Fimbriimonadaceae bacterium]|nr:hypothetical protein [Fimbriimonadaceae bacterium]